MRKWLIGIVIILVIAGAYALNEFGIIGWKPLSMLVAVLAAPLKLIFSVFTDKEEEIRKKHEEIRQAEQAFQANLQNRIHERERNIGVLENELSELDSRLAELREKRAKVDAEIDAMSEEDLSDEIRDIAGS